MKRTVRTIAERAISMAAPMVWRFASGRLFVLMYHRVLPADHPDWATEQPGMFVTPATLRMNLRTIVELGIQFIHLDDWLRAEKAGATLPRLACAVTFDDGWKDNYDHGFEVLREGRVPATIYLVSDLVGTPESLWPYRLGQLLARPGPAALLGAPSWLRDRIAAESARVPARGLAQHQINSIIDFCKSHSDHEMQAIVLACEGAASTSGRTLMNWDEIREMANTGLVRFGSHTRTHARLIGMTDLERLREEVVESASEIAARLGAAPRSFCYPNGDVTDAAVDAARSTYEGAVTTARGWHAAGRDSYRIPRIGVHDDIGRTRSGFVARLSGLL